MKLTLRKDGQSYDVPDPVGDLLVLQGLATADPLWKATFDAALLKARTPGAELPEPERVASAVADAAAHAFERAAKGDDDIAF